MDKTDCVPSNSASAQATVLEDGIEFTRLSAVYIHLIVDIGACCTLFFIGVLGLFLILTHILNSETEKRIKYKYYGIIFVCCVMISEIQYYQCYV